MHVMSCYALGVGMSDSERKKRVTVAMDSALLADLDHIADRMRVSRSGLIQDLLLESAGPLKALLDAVPESPKPQDLIRMRGVSEDLIRERLEQLKKLQDDLFSDIQQGG